MSRVGIGYITIPTDIKREEYISTSIKTSTISIRGNDGAIYTQVMVPLHLWDYITFPEKVEELGSPVSYVLESLTQTPILIGVHQYGGDIVDRRDREFKSTISNQESSIEVVGSLEGSSLSLIVNSSRSSTINLVVKGKKDSKINVTSNGEVNIDSPVVNLITNNIKIRDRKDTVLEYKEGVMEVNTPLLVQKGNQPMVLGTELSSLLRDLLGNISAITVTTPAGPTPINNLAAFSNLISQINNILSKSSKLK